MPKHPGMDPSTLGSKLHLDQPQQDDTNNVSGGNYSLIRIEIIAVVALHLQFCAMMASRRSILRNQTLLDIQPQPHRYPIIGYLDLHGLGLSSTSWPALSKRIDIPWPAWADACLNAPSPLNCLDQTIGLHESWLR